jgi:hypothetical protein
MRFYFSWNAMEREKKYRGGGSFFSVLFTDYFFALLMRNAGDA